MAHMFSSKSLGIASAADAAGFCLGSYAPSIESCGKAAIATYDLAGGSYVALFRGTALKPQSHFKCKSAESRAALIEKWKADEAAADAAKAQRAADKKAARANFVNPLKAGDVLVSSWGYDQTNIDFYEVVSVKAKSVKIMKIGSKCVEMNGPGGNRVIPDKGNYYGEAMTKVVGAGGSVRIASYASAYPWDGNARYETDSMYGH
jgi:hypothetical protein